MAALPEEEGESEEIKSRQKEQIFGARRREMKSVSS